MTAAWGAGGELRAAADGGGGGGGGQRPEQRHEYLASLGHELRGPLQALRVAIAVLEREPAGAPVSGRVIRSLRRQVIHLSRLAEDLLDAAASERGDLTVRLEPLDLCATVRESVDAHRPELTDAGLALDLELPGQPIRVEGDPLRLDQVVSNLLGNAVKFTPRGGRVKLRVSDAADGEALLVVEDDGQGIEPERLSTVFEPFRRGDGERERAAGGLGLGLAVVRRLVEAHGGRVEAQSDGAGRGARFLVRLPCQGRPQIGEPSSPRQGPRRTPLG